MIGTLASYVSAQHCIPSYKHDDSGRNLLKAYEDLLAAGALTAPRSSELLGLKDSGVQFEIGTTEGNEIILEVGTINDVDWFRLIQPDVFPIWIGKRSTSMLDRIDLLVS